MTAREITPRTAERRQADTLLGLPTRMRTRCAYRRSTRVSGALSRHHASGFRQEPIEHVSRHALDLLVPAREAHHPFARGGGEDFPFAAPEVDDHAIAMPQPIGGAFARARGEQLGDEL